MTTVEIAYNPYRLETTIRVNGEELQYDNSLQSVAAKEKRLQEWVSELPEILDRVYNGDEMKIIFTGMALDWDDLCESFGQAKKNGLAENTELEFIELASNEEIKLKVMELFEGMQNSPIEELRDPELKKAFDRLSDAVFPINVIATMSSGKSTLINSLLRKELMPARNQATTATITEILDTDNKVFTAEAVNASGEVVKRVDGLTYDDMDQMNDDPNVCKILVKGDIPFIDSNGMALNLIDTPGPNNSRDDSHRKKTYEAIAGGTNNLILYVLNGTQLETNDDHALLKYVSEQIRKGGKQARDRFLFVVNKMDQYNTQKESIPDAMEKTKEYLSSFGINDPQLYPCSALTALDINTKLGDVDLNDPKAIFGSETALQIYPVMLKLNKNRDMHLERYSTLTPSAQKKLNERLEEAEKNNDIKEQAFIHSGICSLEEAITAYVKKYAVTKVVKDLVETLEAMIEKQDIIAKAKKNISENEDYANKFIEHANKVKKQIENGKEAQAFKNKVDALDPLPEIDKTAEELKETVVSQARKAFSSTVSGKLEITSSQEAQELIKKFIKNAEDISLKLETDLNNAVGKKLVRESQLLLEQYAERLKAFDNNSANSGLNFNTVDLVKDKLILMKENIFKISSKSYTLEVVDELGETWTEEEVIEVKIGEETVKVFDHKEEVGSHREYCGTRMVPNPKKKGFFGKLKFWQPDKIEEDVYKTVTDYKDVYRDETRAITEQRTIEHERFSLSVTELTNRLVTDFEDDISAGIDETRSSTMIQVSAIKAYFKEQFDILDAMIKEKYDEINKCNANAAERQRIAEEQRRIIEWLEEKMEAIRALIDMRIKEEAV